MKLETSPELIAEIRRLRESGKRSADILRVLSERGVLPGIGMMIYFCEAFDLKFEDVVSIGGWSPDGTGDLSDEAINGFLDKAINLRIATKPPDGG